MGAGFMSGIGIALIIGAILCGVIGWGYLATHMGIIVCSRNLWALIRLRRN